MDSKESNKQDVLLDLNFVPTWARKPPGVNPYVIEESERHHESGGRRRGGGSYSDSRSRPRDKRSKRPYGENNRRRSERPVRNQERQTSHTPHAAVPEKREQSGRREYQQRDRAPARHVELPVDIHFIPEKKRLGAVVRQVRSNARAYPLMDVAGLFLASPDNYLIKIEARREQGKPKVHFYQCSICNAVYLGAEQLQQHILSEHMRELFDVNEVEVDAPSGNFVCVGRCGITGELVGPPNYHGFEEKIRRLHQVRFAHMNYDDYRARFEMVHDPDVVEQWKESEKKQTRYQVKDQEDAAEEMTLTQAEQFFMQNLAEKMCHPTSRVMVPAGAGRSVGEGPLKAAMRRAWTRESRHPFTLSIALRPAFKHMGLHLFKAGEGITFVTPVKPHSLDASHAIDSIREVIEFLQEHPGCTRQMLVEGLRPGVKETSELVEVINPLRWLIERGHVIEFFNGTLSVPTSRKKTQ